MKTCTNCGAEKPLEGFPPNRWASDGRSPWCRACANAATRAWRERNPEKAASYYQPVVHEPRECVECGGEFVPGRSDALVCGKKCRWRRKRRLRMAASSTTA
jgi:hypothetical protein